MEPEGISAVIQDCGFVTNCIDSHNEHVLFSSDIYETNNQYVCDYCQVSMANDMSSLGLHGVYLPTESLNVFTSTYAYGDWRLTIQDSRLGEQTIVPWIYEYAIEICPEWQV